MFKDKPLWRIVLLPLLLVAFVAASGNAAETKRETKVSKAAKLTKKESPPPVKMELEPKALEILKAACDKLAAARSMSFTATVTYESPSRLGPPIAYTTKSEVTLKRPDKLKVVTIADGPPSEFYYDGKAMIAFAPQENLIAIAEAPPTIDAALKAAYDSAAIYYPFTNMISSDPYKSVSDGLVLAFYIGQSKVVGGTTTDMVAYANNNVFLQVWIGTEDKLPRMLRGVYRTDKARLRHQLEFTNWQIGPDVTEDAFAPKNAASANPIPFAHPKSNPVQADNAPASGKPVKGN